MAYLHPTWSPLIRGHGRASPAARSGRPDPEVGELVYSGPNVMLGVRDTPPTSAAARGPELRTGDLGVSRGDGLFEVVGRAAGSRRFSGCASTSTGSSGPRGEAGVGARGRRPRRPPGRLVPARRERRRGVAGWLPACLTRRCRCCRWWGVPLHASGKPDYVATAAAPASPATPATATPSSRPRPLRPDPRRDPTPARRHVRLASAVTRCPTSRCRSGSRSPSGGSPAVAHEMSVGRAPTPTATRSSWGRAIETPGRCCARSPSCRSWAPHRMFQPWVGRTSCWPGRLQLRALQASRPAAARARAQRCRPRAPRRPSVFGSAPWPGSGEHDWRNVCSSTASWGRPVDQPLAVLVPRGGRLHLLVWIALVAVPRFTGSRRRIWGPGLERSRCLGTAGRDRDGRRDGALPVPLVLWLFVLG